MPNLSIIIKWAVITFTIISLISNLNVVAETSPPAPEAESPGPTSATLECITLVYNMSDCLSYVEKGSNVSKPDAACCPELAGMMDSNPICLCTLLSKSKDFAVELDLDKAMVLPLVCGLNSPNVGSCQDAGMPVGGSAADAPSPILGPKDSLADAGEPSPVKNKATTLYFGLLYVVVGLSSGFFWANWS